MESVRCETSTFTDVIWSCKMPLLQSILSANDFSSTLTLTSNFDRVHLNVDWVRITITRKNQLLSFLAHVFPAILIVVMCVKVSKFICHSYANYSDRRKIKDHCTQRKTNNLQVRGEGSNLTLLNSIDKKIFEFSCVIFLRSWTLPELARARPTNWRRCDRMKNRERQSEFFLITTFSAFLTLMVNCRTSLNNIWVNSATHEQQSRNHNADKQGKGSLISFLVAIIPPVVSECCVNIHEVGISEIWVQFMEPATWCSFSS